MSNGLPLPATEGRNRDYCGAYFVCFPCLKDYNSASFGWSPVAEFGRRGFIRSLELGSVFFPMAESSCFIHFFFPAFERVFLPGKSHGQRSLLGYSLWGHKESDTIEDAHTWLFLVGGQIS